MTINTRMIPLEAGGKEFGSYFAEPTIGGPGVLLLHAWWGLNPFFKQTCDRIAEQGFIAMAPDLFHGQVAQTIDEARALAEQSDSQLTGDTATAALNYLVHYPARHGRKVGVIGFSFGAPWALILASREADRVGAVALFYGSYEVDFSRLDARVIGHFSDVDEWEPYDQTREVEAKMKAAGVDVNFHVYPGLPHWFMEEDRPEYDAEAARLAWERTFEFLRDSLHANILA
jgi:carboxymethylenebutenolidase